MHSKHFKNYIFLFIFLLFSTSTYGQLDEIGGIGQFELTKDIGEFTSLSAGQEFRFDRNFTSLDRSATSIVADFTVIRRVLKAQTSYILHYKRNDYDHYEFRHRINASLVGQHRINRLILKLRTRGQATFIDSKKREVNYNSRYIWRNRLAIEYNIRKSPFRPYITGEVFTPLNDKKGFFMDAYRLTAGTKYKLPKQGSLNFMLRYDHEVQVYDPKNVLYLSVGWNFDL